MTTRKELIKEVVAEAVEGFRERLMEEEHDRELEKIGEKSSEIESQKFKAFVAEHGKEAYYALYQEPYFIGVGVNGIGMQEVQLRNQRTGLIMASAGKEAVAIQRFEKVAQQKREGRPPEMAGGKKVNTYLDAESIAIATKLGKGNVSEGIRKALRGHRDLLQK